jgi:hypothetical protein
MKQRNEGPVPLYRTTLRVAFSKTKKTKGYTNVKD